MNADECEEYPRQESIGMKSNLVFEMIIKYIPESSQIISISYLTQVSNVLLHIHLHVHT